MRVRVRLKFAARDSRTKSWGFATGSTTIGLRYTQLHLLRSLREFAAFVRHSGESPSDSAPASPNATERPSTTVTAIDSDREKRMHDPFDTPTSPPDRAGRDFAEPDFLPYDEFDEGIDPSDDITQQATSGSVAAIVQVLNQRLAERGVRTRAMFESGCLQLLCESVERAALDRETLVERVRELLEDIDPVNIRRAQVNARLAREQQLLWLEDIRRQPKQLLWSESLRLRPSNGFVRLWRSFGSRREERRNKPIASRSTGRIGKSSGLGRGIAIGIAIALLAGMTYRQWGGTLPTARTSSSPSPDELANPNLANPNLANPNLANPDPAESPAPANDPSRQPAAPTTSAPPATPDPFAEAVTLATQAANGGQTASTASEWLELSARWQRAAELMEQLPSDDARYQTARDRAATYRKNSEIAQQRAR